MCKYKKHKYSYQKSHPRPFVLRYIFLDIEERDMEDLLAFELLKIIEEIAWNDEEVHKQLLGALEIEVELLNAEEWLEEVRENVENCIDEIDAYLEDVEKAESTTFSYRPGRSSLFGFKGKKTHSEKGSLHDLENPNSSSETAETSENVDDFEESKSVSIEANIAAMRVKQEKKQRERKGDGKGRDPGEKSTGDWAHALQSDLSSESDTDNDASQKEAEDNEAGELSIPKELDSLFRGLKKPQLAIFSGDKDLYHDLRAQFDVFVHQTKVPEKVKMMMLKSAVLGKPLKVIERLGYSPAQYKTALEKLDQKYGGEKLLLQRHSDTIFQAPEVSEDNLKQPRSIFRPSDRHRRETRGSWVSRRIDGNLGALHGGSI
ncbi:predicted protein [Nematostella vectensis]|uniref:Uncharacterized protein n=1 Tax=Nematostella vectensis TaxID=45351 RepID=A7SRU1_NEMVE|nr:predicted protein [Nematostella vectensis]|eukprot:XP_001625675.1 predicted protein [Nematostella vectensis]